MVSPETLKIPAFMRKKQLSKKTPKAITGRLAIKKVKKVKKASVKKMKKTPRVTKLKRTVAKLMKKRVVKKLTQRPNTPFLIPVGIVTHFYDKISVAVLKLSGVLKTGDRLQLSGKKGVFEQTVDSMQLEHEPIFVAKKGADIGIKVKKPAKTDQIAYLLR